MKTGMKVAVGCALAAILLLIVVVVAGIVAAILIPSVAKSHDRAVALPPDSGVSAPAGYSENASSFTGAFVYQKNDVIYHVAREGATPVRIGRGNFPALSPDGRFIAFGRLEDGEENRGAGSIRSFAILEIATGTIRDLMPTGAAMSAPAWSPDGSTIALVAFEDGFDGSVHLVDAAGGAPICIYPNRDPGGMLFDVSWSTDGRVVRVHDMQNMIAIPREGGEPRRTSLTAFTGTLQTITSSDYFVQSPTDPDAWVFTQSLPGSPAFERILNGEPITTLHIYDQRSAAGHRLTPDSIVAFAPSWSRDGRWILFTGYHDHQAGEENPFRIFRIRPDGNDLEELCRGDAASY